MFYDLPLKLDAALDLTTHVRANDSEIRDRIGVEDASPLFDNRAPCRIFLLVFAQE
ncbi:hypothetical protein [Bradyrhizobium liaoningense]|uniref:hypothetical protein n=1 Tax=Bradyrhizobium liaoningense TaxID=43992 RepID=UPI001BA476E6|nr:hypothetical protein [Bradyrhizobium liaoningense]MBR0907165.1 hypothetical protein [Bradyrhizobium liaoningense]